MENLNFIKDVYSEETGGGLECDVLRLDDNTILVISKEAIVLYPNISAWDGGRGATKATIFRAMAYPKEA